MKMLSGGSTSVFINISFCVCASYRIEPMIFPSCAPMRRHPPPPLQLSQDRAGSLEISRDDNSIKNLSGTWMPSVNWRLVHFLQLLLQYGQEVSNVSADNLCSVKC